MAADMLINGCSEKTISKEVTIVEEIIVDIDVSPEDNLLTDQQITFTPSNSNFDEYQWEFGDGNSSSATIASNEYSQGGVYTVEILQMGSGEGWSSKGQ